MSTVTWAVATVPTVLGIIAGFAGARNRVEGWHLYMLSGGIASMGVTLVMLVVSNSWAHSGEDEGTTYDCSVDVVILEDGSNACASEKRYYEPSMEEQFFEQTILSGDFADDTYPWFRP